MAALNSGTCDVVMFPIGPYADERYEQIVLPLAQENRDRYGLFQDLRRRQASGRHQRLSPGHWPTGRGARFPPAARIQLSRCCRG